jgi:hypothetical protein
LDQANPALGVLLHATGGLAAASFYIPYKRVKGWSWEIYWILGGVFSWIVAPWAVSLAILPQTLDILRNTTATSLFWTFFFGVLWGVGGLTFGLTMRYLGIALGYAIALGLCAAFGTLIPPLFAGQLGDIVSRGSGQVVVLGVLVCLAGIAVSGRAGLRKESEVSEAEKKATVAEFSLARGMAVAIACGVMSACMAFAFAAGKPIAEAALRAGAPSLWQNLPVLIVVMAGGFLTNFGWCVFLSLRKGTWGEFWGSSGDRAPLFTNYLLCAVAGVIWYLQFFFYSMGTTRMGRYDFSSWTLHMASIIVFSTLWGISLREWSGTSAGTKRLVAVGLALLVASTVVVGYGNALAAAGATPAPPITVASYYFGNYHPGDPRNVKNKGEGWSEWELVKAARPRFPGHPQPKVPLWGYLDESLPGVMERKIAAAADHGIGAFIFDWYYYDDGPFLDRPIDRGFLRANNNHRLKFAFMWANHDWLEIQPYKRGTPPRLLFPGKVTPTTFEKIGDHLIRDYFSHPSYWRIEGRPYFSFYDLSKLLESFGSVAATRAALDQFRARAKAAGLPGLHLNAVVWGQPILPGEGTPADATKLVRELGFDSVTSYVWIHHVPLPRQVTDYDFVRDRYFEYWSEAEKRFDVPYFPNVSMGWDSSPRAAQEDEFGDFGYPFTNTIGGNTPERFRAALQKTKERLLAQPGGPRILNINCWNEWTEGSYLEPDVVNGMKYLEAVRDVFGARP